MKFTVTGALLVKRFPHVKSCMLNAWRIVILAVRVDVALKKSLLTLIGTTLVIFISIPGTCGDDNVMGKVSPLVYTYVAMLLSLMNHLRNDRSSMVHVNCTSVGQTSPSNGEGCVVIQGGRTPV